MQQYINTLEWFIIVRYNAIKATNLREKIPYFALAG